MQMQLAPKELELKFLIQLFTRFAPSFCMSALLKKYLDLFVHVCNYYTCMQVFHYNFIFIIYISKYYIM